jgi:hypothetical protein
VEGWYRYLGTRSGCERQKKFAGGAGGFVVLVWGSSMIAVTIVIIMITTAVIASVTSRIGVVSVLRVTCAGNAGVPGS